MLPTGPRSKFPVSGLSSAAHTIKFRKKSLRPGSKYPNFRMPPLQNKVASSKSEVPLRAIGAVPRQKQGRPAPDPRCPPCCRSRAPMNWSRALEVSRWSPPAHLFGTRGQSCRKRGRLLDLLGAEPFRKGAEVSGMGRFSSCVGTVAVFENFAQQPWGQSELETVRARSLLNKRLLVRAATLSHARWELHSAK